MKPGTFLTETEGSRFAGIGSIVQLYLVKQYTAHSWQYTHINTPAKYCSNLLQKDENVNVSSFIKRVMEKAWYCIHEDVLIVSS